MRTAVESGFATCTPSKDKVSMITGMVGEDSKLITDLDYAAPSNVSNNENEDEKYDQADRQMKSQLVSVR